MKQRDFEGAEIGSSEISKVPEFEVVLRRKVARIRARTRTSTALVAETCTACPV